MFYLKIVRGVCPALFVKAGNVTRRPIEAKMVMLIDDYIQDCKNRNIKLIFEYAPVYSKTYPYIDKDDSVKNIIIALARKNNIPFLDYSRDPISEDTANFL